MTFEEWWEREVSARRVDETDVMRGVAYAAWRAAFEAGRCEAGTVGLRDKFAMAAMQGFCANRIYHHRQSWGEDIVSDAYIIADAMLKERMK